MVHLHTRSCYTLLKSPFRIQNIVDTAQAKGFTHVALTDLNNMYGVMEFWLYAQSKQMHPIIGLELYATWKDQAYGFVMLAKNDQGLQELYRISSRNMRQDTEDITLGELVKGSQHCVALTAGNNDTLDSLASNKNIDEISAFFEMCQRGWNDFFVSIAMADSNGRKGSNAQLKQCAHEKQIRTVALSRIYYQKKEDVQQLKILRAIATQKKINDQTLDVRYQRYYRSQQEMEALYDARDLEMSDRIADMCNVQMAMKKSDLPQFVNKSHIANSEYLIRLSKAGLQKRLHHQKHEIYTKRLEYELSTIIRMEFTNYFLIVWDFIVFARKQGIYVGPGRGSAAGSLVAYCLGITHIDPIQNDLLFERFLNPDRVTMPDIDIDFPDDRRDEVIDYVTEKYGSEYVSHIIAFNTMKARQALRDVARVMNYPTNAVDTMSKALGKATDMTLTKAYEERKEFHRLVHADKESYAVFMMAGSIEGLPRHVTIHAAGIVMSNQPILHVCPLVEVDSGVLATQFTKEYLEDFGLIKMDLLSVRNLTTIQAILRSIEIHTQQRIDILKIPMNDARTYQLLSRADSIGIFQLESEGIRNVLKKMKPRCFEDICAVLALFRPGPAQNIDVYIQRREHPEMIRYPDQRLEPILKETYGIIVYQEQIMQIAQVIGGFQLSQADSLRKAMSKKDKKEMASYKDRFIQGAILNRCTRRLAEEIFALMERFAEYGFNKSHSYAYGMVSYQMAYLKANYPLFFYQNILNSEIGSTSKTARFIYECHRRNIPIRTPDVNISESHYKLDENGLRMPLRVIKGIDRKVQREIEKERESGLFKGYVDFVARIHARKVNEEHIHTLIDAGALDDFGYNRATMNKNLKEVLAYAGVVITQTKDKVLFNYDVVSPPSIVQMKEDRLDRSKNEFTVYGFYLSEHPVTRLRKKYPKCLSTAQCAKTKGYIDVIGQIMRLKPYRTKNQALMCFAALEDETGQIDLAIMPKLYSEIKDELKVGNIVFINGKKDQRESILVNRIKTLDINQF